MNTEILELRIKDLLKTLLTAEEIEGVATAEECLKKLLETLLVKKINLEDLEVDDVVLVKDRWDADWVYRHFSHVKNGTAYCFTNGKSSYTVENRDRDIQSWRYVFPLNQKED